MFRDGDNTKGSTLMDKGGGVEDLILEILAGFHVGNGISSIDK